MCKKSDWSHENGCKDAIFLPLPWGSGCQTLQPVNQIVLKKVRQKMIRHIPKLQKKNKDYSTHFQHENQTTKWLQNCTLCVIIENCVIWENSWTLREYKHCRIGFLSLNQAVPKPSPWGNFVALFQENVFLTLQNQLADTNVKGHKKGKHVYFEIWICN